MGSQRPQSVCVVGAGSMGITTAYYLMKSGRCGDITLLEEGQVAGGASGKAAGFLARDWHGAPTAVSLSPKSDARYAQATTDYLTMILMLMIVTRQALI